VSDSTGDRDLRELAVVGVAIASSSAVVPPLPARTPDAALGQEFQVDRAAVVMIKAIVEGVAQTVQAEMPRTT